MQIGEIERIRLGAFPTPVQELTNLSAQLGGPRIFIKRDGGQLSDRGQLVVQLPVEVLGLLWAEFQRGQFHHLVEYFS